MTYAIITGAGSGIGAALGDALASRGFDLLLVGRSRRVETVGDALRERYPGFEAVCDRAELSEHGARRALLDRLRNAVSSRAASVGALVHAAGVGRPTPGLSAMDPAALEHAFAVNVTAPLALTQGLLPVLGDD